MHKRLLGAALAMGALLAGHQATQPQPTAPQPSKSSDLGAEVTLKGKDWQKAFQRDKPAPAKPTAPVAAQRQVTVKARPLAMVKGFTPFIEKPHLRKVKYGKRRWVIV